MIEDILREAIHEMFSSLEALETQNAAILYFLKEKGIATDEALAPHLEQAANASNVRWRAAQVRIDYLLSSATKAAEKQSAKKEKEKEKESARTAAPPDSQPNAAKKSARSDAPENPPEEATQGAEAPLQGESPSPDKEKENAA